MALTSTPASSRTFLILAQGELRRAHLRRYALHPLAAALGFSSLAHKRKADPMFFGHVDERVRVLEDAFQGINDLSRRALHPRDRIP